MARARNLTRVEVLGTGDDARVFDAPFRFDVRRNPNPHIAFGRGIHFWLGANLARLEIRILFEELLDHFDDIALDSPPRWTRDNRLFGLKHLPIRFKTVSSGQHETRSLRGGASVSSPRSRALRRCVSSPSGRVGERAVPR